MSLGSRIRQARKDAGLTQKDLANHFDIEPPSVSEWENDKTRPESSRLPELARLLQKSVDWLLADDGTHKPIRSGKSPALREEISTYSPAASNESAKNHVAGDHISVYSNVGRRTPAPEFGGGLRDLPVKGTAVGGDHDKGVFLFNGEVVDHVNRPARLARARDAFVIHLIGDSMMPRFRDGARLYIHPGQPARIGDDVLVELHAAGDGEAGAAMVKELVARTTSKLKLKQWNPERIIELDLRKVKHIYRVVPYDELLDF